MSPWSFSFIFDALGIESTCSVGTLFGSPHASVAEFDPRRVSYSWNSSDRPFVTKDELEAVQPVSDRIQRKFDVQSP
jgi:hypothetical protein